MGYFYKLLGFTLLLGTQTAFSSQLSGCQKYFHTFRKMHLLYSGTVQKRLFPDKKGYVGINHLNELYNKDIVVLDGTEKPIVGKLNRFSLESSNNESPDSHLYLVEMDDGRVVAISDHSVVKELEEGDKDYLKNLDYQFSDRQIEMINSKKLRSKICKFSSLIEENPILAKLYNQVVRYKKINSVNLRQFFAACMSMVPVFYGVKLFGAYRSEARGEENLSLVSEHGSNFFQGISYTTMAHCLANVSTMNLVSQKKIIATVLGANFLNQVWEEIKLPLPEGMQTSLHIHHSEGKRVQTDLKDFTSGLLGILAYYSTMKVLEKSTPDFHCSNQRLVKKK